MSQLIRTALYSDIPYAYQICLQTGNSGTDATRLFKDPYILGQYYAAPYFFYDIRLCFIAELHAVPQGYLVAVQDTEAYRKWLSTEWLPKLVERYPLDSLNNTGLSRNEQNIIQILHSDHTTTPDTSRELYTKYPAHLHIDLLPSLQGKGCGRELMQTLFTELKKRNTPGLHLGVDKDNTTAQGFYKKMGFHLIEDTAWGMYLGITF